VPESVDETGVWARFEGRSGRSLQRLRTLSLRQCRVCGNVVTWKRGGELSRPLTGSGNIRIGREASVCGLTSRAERHCHSSDSQDLSANSLAVLHS
jgi:hypothetical protein